MKETTAQRLKTIMEERKLKQVDILNLSLPYCTKYGVKMNKSDISQYVSGKVEPSQNKLVILGMALGVTEAWLMGFDVPMNPSTTNTEQTSLSEYEHLKKYRAIDDIGKKVVDTVLDREYSIFIEAQENNPEAQKKRLIEYSNKLSKKDNNDL